MSRMGLEISRLRKELGMTQKQLARSIGVTEKFIIEIETGRKIVKDNLLKRISKVLRKEVGNLDIYENKPEPDINVEKVVEKPVQDIWNDALSGVIMNVPVYNYKMDRELGKRKLPIIANKVEGLPKDKVIYLLIEDDDMKGFRLNKGDLALAFKTSEVDRSSIYLIEYKEKKMIRQLRAVSGGKIILVQNSGSIITNTVYKKDVDVLARLIRLEINL
ncbi:helix-turn-helix transcriptional regulator [Herbivorax sp. ANBcel31]|uniref:helix-turn-helix transcriptional regulator n=1 Tax=Herbivorax sp. ANBcel31 TaxID=3069754 RepID=UPI0027B09739|nr:helix-turn-helix transcriptional regulator [Herbivorax sp. ANBcel31]MDQ2087125.1 helix-turn-helix transcriptional regulator [Herbivorax sp. ANBcel31]